MTNENPVQINATAPTSIWTKPVTVKWGDMFKALAKGGSSLFFGSYGAAAGSVADIVAALGLEGKKPETLAWLLVQRALFETLKTLSDENEGIWTNAANDGTREQIAAELDETLKTVEISIGPDFFNQPRTLEALRVIQPPFIEWLKALGLSARQAQSVCERLPAYFVLKLHEEWGKNTAVYAPLKEALDTPFTRAAQREAAWQLHTAQLQKAIEEPVFWEAFSLQQVYVPLRAYFETRVKKTKDHHFAEHSRSVPTQEEVTHTLVDLASELNQWLEKGDPRDAIRVVSGGPGSGKSSFAKMFAASQAAKRSFRVLFVPLHRIDFSKPLDEALGEWVSLQFKLTESPLDPNVLDRLLIIFDGLDEIEKAGEVGLEVAKQFVADIAGTVGRFNHSGEIRLQVLITGRDLAVQANSGEFKKDGQVLQVLPYLVSRKVREDKEFVDTKGDIETDQRSIWWRKYGQSGGYGYTTLPEKLNIQELEEITTQPLLNYLVAFSYTQKQIDFSKEVNHNTIYEGLLSAIYKRVWADKKNLLLKGISQTQFIYFLEEVAVTAWHGEGRTTTYMKVEDRCKDTGLSELFGQLDTMKKTIARLLLAFYVRETSSENKCLEFTHKSFGEYLTARRIVRAVGDLHEALEHRRTKYTGGYTEPEALLQWAKLCGPKPIDGYLLEFVRCEIRLKDEKTVSDWRETFCRLFNTMLRGGMPMEQLGLTFKEQCRQAKNAEESLLIVAHLCADQTQTQLKIKWPKETDCRDWLAWIQNQMDGVEIRQIRDCIRWLDFSNLSLRQANLYKINLYGASLEGADLVRANLEQAYLVTTNLFRAGLADATLRRANLIRANLNRANLVRANLEGAYLQKALLQKAHLEDANLFMANLKGANLEDANLERATWVDGRYCAEGSIGKCVDQDGNVFWSPEMDNDNTPDNNPNEINQNEEQPDES